MFFSYNTLNSFYVHQQNVLSLYSEEAGTTMSHSGMCTAFFLGPSEPATGNGDTAEYWSFVLPHYYVLLKITDAWSVKFKGNERKSSLRSTLMVTRMRPWCRTAW